MKKSVIPVFLVLLAGCGRKVTRFEVGQESVTAFEQASQAAGNPVRVDNLIIEWGGKPDVEANCETGMGTPKIQVNRARWDQAGPERREIVLFHEMGHCVLGRSHMDALKDGIPGTLMHSGGPTVPVYQRHRAYYLKELFGAR